MFQSIKPILTIALAALAFATVAAGDVSAQTRSRLPAGTSAAAAALAQQAAAAALDMRNAQAIAAQGGLGRGRRR